MIEPRSAGESVFDTLNSARALIEDQDFDSAASVYFNLLKSELAPALRGEVLTNLGAALCMSSRSHAGPAALQRLDQARSLLADALPLRARAQMPQAWATTRANLALVHLARYETTNSDDDLLAAHLALDEIDSVLPTRGEGPLRDWIAAIRDQLVELRDRRAGRR